MTPLSSLTEMSYFIVGGNKISGSIPQSFFNMPKLVYLYLDDNQLTGPIPPITSSEPSDVKSLRDLNLDSNSLTGTIPSTLRSLSNLRTLHLDNNRLSGTIPVLDQITLEDIDLSVNYLTMGSLEAVPLSTFSNSTLSMVIALQSNCLVFRNPSNPSQDVSATHCKG